jgi:hypothetical protein
MSDDDDSESFEVHGMALPVPKSLVDSIIRRHDREHMEVDHKKMGVFALLDALDKDQLLALRTILNLGENGTNYVDGMVAAQLRLVHKVDPDTGNDLLV